MSKEKLLESFRNIAGITELREGRMAEVDQIMQDIASGELDPQDIVHNPKTPVEQYAAQQLQSMYDRVMEDPDMMQRYGIRSGDDDFEQVWSAVCDMVAQDYGTDIGTPSPRMEGAVLIGMTMNDIRKAAGLQESFEDRLEAAREKARAKGKLKDEEEKKPAAVRKVSGSSYGGSKQKEDADEGSGKPAPAEKKEEAPKAAPKKEEPKKEAKPAASGGSFSSIAKTVLKSGGGAAAVKAACAKAGVTVPNHLHSRLNALKKNLKESFYIITHPQMPSFVLAENEMMNQYQWISTKEDNISLEPMVFETEDGAKQVVKYMNDYKNQYGTIVKIED